jgi:TldD protein
MRFGDHAEAFAEETRRLALRWEDGRLIDVTNGAVSGVSLRWRVGDETRFTHLEASAPFSRGLSRDEIDRLAASARGVHPSGRRSRTTSGEPRTGRHDVIRPPFHVSLEKKAELLRLADRTARRRPGVRQVALSYGEVVKTVGGILSAGDGYGEERTYVTFTVQVTAERGRERQTGYEAIGGLAGMELLDPARVARAADLAARRAVAKLSARPAPAGEMPVVIASEAGGTLIHEAIGHALEADHVQDGSSPHFAGKIGRVVAGPKVTVLDDPTRPGHRGSFIFDDEGTPAERTVLVENGVLKTYLFDRRTAARARRASNGHGRRESFAHRPIPRMSNTFIAPGPDDPAIVRRSVEQGLLVTRMGGGQVNTATGDFVFEVEEGFLLNRGRPPRLVRGASLLGNAPEVLRSIDLVGRDLGWSVGTCGKEGQGVPVSDGVPTLRIPKIVVGGSAE